MTSGFNVYRKEGTGSALIARLFVGLFDLRDQILLLNTPEEQRDSVRTQFDQAVQPLFEAAEATRDAAVEIRDLVQEHVQEIDTGNGVTVRENQIDIDVNIDRELGQAVDKLLTQLIIATKSCLQPMLRDVLRLDIGFFFQKESAFRAGISSLVKEGDHALAAYLEVAREWHEMVQILRGDIEHHRWRLEPCGYDKESSGKVTAVVPRVFGGPVDEFAVLAANRSLTLIEDLIAHSLQRMNRLPFFLAEIPVDQRDPAYKKRFQISVGGVDASRAWFPVPHDHTEFVELTRI